MKRIARTAGSWGVCGALTLFCGDMLLFGHVGAGATFRESLVASAAAAAPQRLYAGGLLGSIGALLCLAGIWHIGVNLNSVTSLISKLMLALFVLFIIAAGAFHVLSTATVLALKFCSGQSGGCGELLGAVRIYGRLCYFAALVPCALASLMLVILVLRGQTSYPPWAAVANPLLLLLVSPVLVFVPAPIGASLVAGSPSLCLAAFFLVSTLTAGRRRDAAMQA